MEEVIEEDVKAKFVSFTILSEIGKFPRCPDSEEHLCSLRSIDRNSSLLIFISHCWLRGDATPQHPDNEENDKYKLCIEGIGTVWKVFAPRMKHCYVWMDYCCMNQDKENLLNELSNYDKIVEFCDVMFTPIVDPDHASWSVKTYSDLIGISKAKSWCEGPRAYLNRAWCRVEMLYAAHIPVLDNINSEVKRHTMFESGLAYHCREGRRFHVLYGTKDFVDKQYPKAVPPLQYRFLEDCHPLKGELTKASDKEAIEELLTILQPYIEMNTKELGYIGSFDTDGQKHGHGVCRYLRGGVYEGNFEKDVKHGYGVYRYSDGGVYEGNWENDKSHGHGVYRYPSGGVYEGNWENGLIHGHGAYRYPDGGVYEGIFENDERHGHGVYHYADGGVYEGNFKNGLMHGHGLYRYADGSVYEGNFENDMMHGQGVYTTDDTVYEGDFENDKMHGHGVLRNSGSVVYIGVWKNDAPVEE